MGIITIQFIAGPLSVSAQTPTEEPGICWSTSAQKPVPGVTRKADCVAPNTWTTVQNNQAVTTPGTPDTDLLENEALAGCGVIIKGTLAGCLVALFYYIFNGLAAGVLAISARFFDLMLPITLSGSLYGDFINTAWVIVRDISNIFFILILLYVAMETILGIGHGTKKVIANVVIMALLINFSMFFTKVVIDSSNVLALVFYNKMDVKVVDKDGNIKDINYNPVLDPSQSPTDKDVAGALVNKFNPTKLLDADFFDRYRKTEYEVAPGINNVLSAYIWGKLGASAAVALGGPAGWVAVGAGAVGYLVSSTNNTIPVPMMLTLIVVSGAMMFFAAYAFFIAGLAFLGRLIEFWVLIIASPFAFMSFALPQLSGVSYVGWKDWLHRLLKSAFMAPIFLFFMYLIILLIQADPIGALARRPPGEQTWMEYLLLLLVPSLLIMALLLKATQFAKKGAGELGEVTIGAGKAALGLALGGAAVGTAFVGRNVLGRAAAGASRSDEAVARGKALAEYKMLPFNQRTGFNQFWQQYQANNNLNLAPRTGFAGLTDRLGGARLGARINASQKKTGEVGHAKHDWDDLKKKADAEGVSDANLSGVTLARMREEFDKANESNIEKFMRRGEDNKGKTLYFLDPANNNAKTAVISEDQYKATKRQKFIDAMIGTPQAAQAAIAAGNAETYLDAGGVTRTRLSGQGNRKVDDQLKEDYSTNYLKPIKKRVLDYKYHELEHEKDATVDIGERVLSRTSGGSYDARALADLAIKEGGAFRTKLLTGLTLAIAGGIRAGLKKVDVNVGKPQGTFLKDLSITLTDALKSANVKVDVSHVAEEHKEDSHGGGGHH